MKHYKSIDVWRRLNDERVVRYRCFEVLPDGGFCVQSADFFDAPVSIDRILEHERQYVELLIEDAPDERSEPHETLEAAIEAHDKEFR